MENGIRLTINSLLDGEAVVQYLDFHSDKAGRLGNSLKCHCPVHKESGFKTLYIDLSKHRAQCIVKECPAHNGIDLVKLTALARQTTLLHAAWLLAGRFSLPTPDGFRDQALEELMETAAQHSSAARHEDAARLYSFALDLDRHHRDASRALARSLEAAGRTAEASNQWRCIQRDLENPEERERILKEEVLRLTPNDCEAIGELSDIICHRRPGDAEWGWLLVRRGRIRQGEGELHSALSDFRTAFSVLQTKPEFLMELAKLYIEAGEISMAVKELSEAAAIHEMSGEDRQAAECLELITQHQPADREASERLATLHERLGNLQEYLEKLEEEASAAREASDLHKAREIYEALAKRRPDDIRLWRTIADITRETNDFRHHGEAMLRAAAELIRSGADEVEILSCLADFTALEEQPIQQMHRAEVLCQQANAPILRGRILLRLAERTVEEQPGEAAAALAKIPVSEPECAALLADGAFLLRPHSQPDASRLLMCALKALADQGEWEQAEQLLQREEQHPVFGGQPGPLLLMATILDRRGAPDQAANARLKAFESLLKAGESQLDEILLERTASHLAECGWEPLSRLLTMLDLYTLGTQAEEILRDFIMSCNQPEEGLAAISYWNESRPSNDEIKRQEARYLRQSERISDAVAIYTDLLESAIAQAESGIAKEILDEALECAPEDHTLEALALKIELIEEDGASAERLRAFLCREEPELAQHRLNLAETLREHSAGAELRMEIAEVFFQNGENERAAEQFRQHAEQIRGENSEQVLAARQRVVEVYPESSSDWVMLSDALRDTARQSDSRQALLHAFELEIKAQPEYRELSLIYESFIARDQRFRELTRRFLEELKRRGEQETASQVARDYISSIENDTSGQELVEILELAWQYNRNDPGLSLRYARALMDSQQQERARELAEAVLGTLTLHDESLRLEALEILTAARSPYRQHHEEFARLQFRAGFESDAASTLERFVAMAESAGDHDPTIPFLMQVVEWAPDRFDARRRLIVALETAGDIETASEQRLELAERLLQTGDWHGAFDLWEDLEEPERRSLRGQTLEFKLLMKKQSWREAMEKSHSLVKQASAAGKREVAREVLLLLAESGQSEGSELRALLEAFPEITSESEKLLLILIQEQEKDNAPAASVSRRRLADHYLKLGNRNAAKEQLVEAWEETSEPEMIGEKLLELIEGAEEPGLHREIREKLAFTYLAAQQYSEAAHHLEILLPLHPDHAVYTLALAEAMAALQQETKARELFWEASQVAEANEDTELYQRILEKRIDFDPHDIQAIMEMLSLTLDSHNWKAAEYWTHKGASHFENAGDWEKAQQLLEEYLECDPASVDTRERLFQSFSANGETHKATEALREIYRLYSRSGAIEPAIDTVRRMQSLDPDNYENLEMLGGLYEQILDKEQACNCFMEAARLMAEAGKDSEALAVTDRIVELMPHHEVVHSLRSDIFVRQGAPERAAKELLALAENFTSDESWEELVRTLEKLLSIDSDNERVREQLAMLQSDLDNPLDAAEHFTILADTRRRKAKLPAAMEAVNTAITIAPDFLEARSLKAELLIASEEMEQAGEALLWLVDYHERNMEYESALRHLRRHPLYNDSSYMTLRAADLKNRIGDKEEARELLSVAEKQAESHKDPETRAKILKSSLEIDPSNLDQLDRVVKKFLETGETQAAVECYFLSFEHFLEDGDVEAAESVYNKLSYLRNSDTQVRRRGAVAFEEQGIPELAAREHCQLARIYMDRDNLGHAKQELDMALSLKPNDFIAMDMKISLLQKEEEFDSAKSLAQDMLHHFQQRGEFRKAASAARRLISLEPNNTGYRKILIELLSSDPKASDLEDQLQELAEYYLQNANYQEAVQTLRRMISIRKDNTRALIYYIDAFQQIGEERDLLDEYLALGEAHASHGASFEATRAFERALALAPESPKVHVKMIEFFCATSQETRAVEQIRQLCQLEIRLKQPRKALEIMDQYSHLIPEEAAFFELRGQAHLANREKGLAARQFHQAVRLYRERDDAESEIALLKELTELDPYDLELRERLADRLVEAGEKQEAVINLEQIGASYLERDLADLAAREFRRAITLAPERTQSWHSLFNALEKLQASDDLYNDYIRFADLLARKGNAQESVDYYQKALDLRPNSIDAKKGFVTQFPKFGQIADIVEDILDLGQALVEQGEVDEGVRFFELAMSADPTNSRAVEMLSATQSRGDQSDFDDDMDSGTDSFSDSPSNPIVRHEYQPPSPDIYLAGTLNRMETNENQASLQQVVDNYREILSINGKNPKVRAKLAEVLEQMGRIPEMLEELGLASEYFLRQDALDETIECCERFLELRPKDHIMRKRLNEAVLKRDAMKMLNSSILFSEEHERKDQ